MKKFVCSFLVTICLCVLAGAQSTSPFSLSLTPGVDIPLGPIIEEGTEDETLLYSIGGSALLSGEYTMPFAPFLFAKGSVGYGMLSIVRYPLDTICRQCLTGSQCQPDKLRVQEGGVS